MQERQSHGPVKVSKAVIVSIDEVKGQGPLDWTAATSRWSTYQTGPVTVLNSSSLCRTVITVISVSVKGN